MTIGHSTKFAKRSNAYLPLVSPAISRLAFVDDSATVAAARARLAQNAERKGEKRKGEEPYYGGGRASEEVVPESCQLGILDGLVTRNHYGCLVLNAAHALFIDVDVEAPMPNEPSTPFGSVLDDVRTVLAHERDLGFRIYRTAAGYRILATTRRFDPGSRESNRLMSIVGADSAFVELCRVQQNYRARLTPKPWRCGVRRPPNQFPRMSAHERLGFEQWLGRYEQACRNHATCQYLGHVGVDYVHDRIRPVVDLHDSATKALEPLPLA
jgi:hypothetical protein